MEKPWYQKAIIYELYVDKFAGNFRNLTSKIQYLASLGVNTLWLLPHYPSPLVDGGYDVSDYYSIRSDLGTMADFDEFLKKAHEQNLKVVLDLVLNHTSTDHSWFKDHSDWYLRSNNQSQFSAAFVHFPELKNYSNWIRDPVHGGYYYASFYPEQPDLNWDNPEVVEEMYKVADFWLDLGVDGFRLDAISRLIKRDGTNCFALPETHEVLKRFRTHIDQKYQNRVLIAETGGWPQEAVQFFSSCHIVLHFPLAMHLLAGIPYMEKNKFEHSFTNNWGGFLTNHDSVDLFFLRDDGEKNWFLNEIDPNRRFTNQQDSSMGARLAEICKGNTEKIIWAFEQLLSLPIVPIIYYGNEIGMRNLNLSSKPSDIRDYVRGNFDWAEADHQTNDPNSLLNKVRALIQNRK